ncbi:hypothetical protein HS048_32980 [Planomonospora sp. ID91781]|uniref:trypsin-like serine peptidase n=1 Tax=Planomonospora sp. ID91781 TaxID=2738135 RepID=UPI0018C38A9F|nr:hypothetical protein [Planomonospora sp. ID91781]MBG0825506.1 hypothetical protein [Planomonospora sp. ID91781]MBG0825507.1 hypothetical protein [Planomonospora sp. ID91781]
MKRILLPAGGAILATGLLAAGLAGTAQAAPDWAHDTMAKGAPEAKNVIEFWTASNYAALKNATPYSWDVKATPSLKVGGGYSPDGKPGSVVPIGEEKKSASVVKNINLPKTIGKVFFVDQDGKPRWCSGSSIQGKYRNLVATAGHCVYDEGKNAEVASNWIFVPGYYQGKTPWGIYVGKTAYTHYDFAAFEDRDRDYAFVTVYNGVQIGGQGTVKEVSKAEYEKYEGLKDVKAVEITKEQYDKCVLNLGDCFSEGADAPADKVGPDYPGAVLEREEVNEKAYTDAKVGKGNGNKLGEPEVEHVTKTQYDAYKGLGTKKIVDGNYTITHYYVQKWVKPATAKKYFKNVYVIAEGFIKDVGRLGDNVGGQGFAWNQKTGQKVFVFGYPADAHPDGHKAYTGITPKWCYGTTTGKTYTHAATKVEEHVGLKCAMTPGADGSPWLIKYSNAKRLGYVNGVTSLFGDQDKNDRYDLSTSAYFDGETAAIYNQAANVWSGSFVK